MSEIRTVDGKSRSLEAEAIRELASTLRSAILVPDDADHDDWRRIWNGMIDRRPAMIDRRPALIARCVDAADVVIAVNFAAWPASLFRCEVRRDP